MARTVQQIYNSFVRSLVSTAASIGITIDPTKWVYVPGDISQTDYKLLLLNASVDSQATEEQLNDAAIVDIDNQVRIIAPQTAPWFQNRALNVFQFNSLVPQVPKLITQTFALENVDYKIKTFAFSPVIDSYKVIKYCSAIFGSSGVCLLKVAGQSGGLPIDLDTAAGAGALAAYQAFVNTDAAPGISYIASSGASDKLFLQYDVYFNGLYAGVIFNNVKAAIIKYLSTKSESNPNGIDFNGQMKNSSLEDAIQAVEGVTDVVPKNLGARKNSVSFATAYAGGYNLINNNTEIQRLWNTFAGYISLEDTVGKTLSDFRVGSSGALNLNCIAE